MILSRYPRLVKNSLSGHSWIGLSVSALMYLVCLTGTLCVFFEEFERWEQADVPEFQNYSVPAIERAVDSYLELEGISKDAEGEDSPLFIVLPTPSVPRMHISSGGKEWFVDQQGNLVARPVNGWLQMLTALHIYLHFPNLQFGIIVVGVLGILLCSLVISGLLAHPKIFRDAFRLRMGGSKHTEQADIHNRLSVWGIPFYLAIALTGAFVGLVGVIMYVAALAFYDGDLDAAFDAIYGGDPEIQISDAAFNYQFALDQLSQFDAEAVPEYFLLNAVGADTQYLEIGASLPGRLMYSEIYRFTAAGEMIDHQGFSDGSIGRQIAYSVYKLHFGNFAGMPMKIIYAILGLGLTVVSATGVNIWLVKRKQRTLLNPLWVAVVWGTPLALAVSACAALFAFSPIWVFCLSLLASTAVCLWVGDEAYSRYILKLLLTLALVAILICYLWVFGQYNVNPAALGINSAIALGVILCFVHLFRQRKQIKENRAQVGSELPVSV